MLALRWALPRSRWCARYASRSSQPAMSCSCRVNRSATARFTIPTAGINHGVWARPSFPRHYSTTGGEAARRLYRRRPAGRCGHYRSGGVSVGEAAITPKLSSKSWGRSASLAIKPETLRLRQAQQQLVLLACRVTRCLPPSPSVSWCNPCWRNR